MGTQKNRLNETFFFEHMKHMFKLMDKEINAILGAQTILIWNYDTGSYHLYLTHNSSKDLLTFVY